MSIPTHQKAACCVRACAELLIALTPGSIKALRYRRARLKTLLVSSGDEAFTKYCLICERLEYPVDRTWIIFHLRPQAKWHDGKPITPADVVWSFNTLMEKGTPSYRFYYADVEHVEASVSMRFDFNLKIPATVNCRSLLANCQYCLNTIGRDMTKSGTLPKPH